jgi:hypothetical protein
MISWNWKNIKKNIKSNDTKNRIYLQNFTVALSDGYITKHGNITYEGYKLYVSILTVLGKTSMYNGPVRKIKILFIPINDLIGMELIKYHNVKMIHELTDKGKNLLDVIIMCMKRNGVPRL